MEKNGANTNRKKFIKTFFSKVNTVGLDDGSFFEDDSCSGLWEFGEDERDSIEGECEGK